MLEECLDGVPVIDVPDELMNIVIDFMDGIPIICPVGEIDCFTAPKVLATGKHFLAAGYNYLVFDLTELKYADSTCVHTMVKLLDDARRRNGNVALVIADDYSLIRRVFEVTKSLHQFDVRSTITEARHLLLS